MSQTSPVRSRSDFSKIHEYLCVGRVSTSAIKKGVTPRNTSCTLHSFLTPATTKQFSPIGGVIRQSSAILTTIIPNQIEHPTPERPNAESAGSTAWISTNGTFGIELEEMNLVLRPFNVRCELFSMPHAEVIVVLYAGGVRFHSPG